MPEGYCHVTRDVRCQIYALKSTGQSMRMIAANVGVHVSTVSREIARNTGGRGYRINQADNMSKVRRSAASQQPKKLAQQTRELIRAKLVEDWSPEQISGRLKLEGISISHETIYKYVWQDKRDGGNLYKHLRHHGKRYNKRSSAKAGRGCIPERVDISERPAIVAEKSRIGDWEGDTVISAVSKTALLTLVDRHSKFTRIKKLGRKTAQNVRAAMSDRIKLLPHPVHTVTYDNGKEFAAHKKISADLKTVCYFATPYHSWERGLNEHTNGLIRQYLPKSFDFKNVTDDEVQLIEDKLNNRPRKALQYRTPSEVFFATDSSNTVALHS